MGTFSIWHWLLVLLIVGGIVSVIVITARRRDPMHPSQISGFGGWLLLLAIGQCLSPLRNLGELAAGAEGYRTAATMPNGTVLVAGEILINLAFIAFQVYVVVAMLKRWVIFPRLFLYQWFLIMALPIIDVVWVATIMGMPLSRVFPATELGSAIGAVIALGIWVWYTSVSVRVRNTFTR